MDKIYQESKAMKLAILIILAILMPHFGAVGADGGNEVILVVAKPVRTKFVMNERDMSRNEGTERIYMGAVYETKLRILDVISGKITKRRITVQLVATNRGYLSRDRTLVVLLQKDEDGELSTVGWQLLENFVCLPTGTIEEYGLEDDFRSGELMGHRKCVPTT